MSVTRQVKWWSFRLGLGVGLTEELINELVKQMLL